MRGIVLSTKELAEVDWPSVAARNGINTIGTHITPSEVVTFLGTDKGRSFTEACRKNGITVEHQLHAMAEVLRPGNHRYYFWLDDNAPVCCCPLCREYSPSEQALVVENCMLRAIRQVDPEARLAHLAYSHFMEPPGKVHRLHPAPPQRRPGPGQEDRSDDTPGRLPQRRNGLLRPLPRGSGPVRPPDFLTEFCSRSVFYQ